ncbi:hypothetical protein DD829_22535 [Chryseobacterium sp. HMWF035]|nr:hypothetical protein DBR25_07810 [Chryseobacterium sp. HMWF001]PVV50443.1 hypothetical protein DD829_22535 [Chryseobacterium sp. HMWF035]
MPQYKNGIIHFTFGITPKTKYQTTNTSIMKKEPFLEYFNDIHKATDFALWQSFKHRKTKEQFGILDGPVNNYAVVNRTMLEDLDMEFRLAVPEDYHWMNYAKIRLIRTDEDPLPHWEELMGAFSVMSGEILRFILHYRIPLKKIIRYELASRGFDENHEWVGFEKAKQIWMK